ncbi:hypothetical protein, partial [Bradyrhizobium liaoningense]|uniref:hypothetical protein n=1 Tax=Bradyrhizobium liaoningense TaxID=43992 RepID=UPI001BAB07BC
SLLIRSKNPRRCQAENPLKLLSEFAGPALSYRCDDCGGYAHVDGVHECLLRSSGGSGLRRELPRVEIDLRMLSPVKSSLHAGAERQRDDAFLMLRLGLTKYVGMVAPIIGFDLNTRLDRTTWNIGIIAWNAANVSVMPGIRSAHCQLS